MSTNGEFAVTYQHMSDPQLLQIAAEGGLVHEASIALQAEMQKRKLTSQMAKTYQSETAHYELAQKAEQPHVYRSLFGLGFRIFGKDYLSAEDESRGIPVGTKWFTLRGVPIIPIASYRYSSQDDTTGLERVIDQVPLNWNQVWRTWVKTTGLLLLGLALLFAFLVWQDKAHGR